MRDRSFKESYRTVAPFIRHSVAIFSPARLANGPCVAAEMTNLSMTSPTAFFPSPAKAPEGADTCYHSRVSSS